jgi:hypothetical protein
MNWFFAFRRNLVAKPDYFGADFFHPQIAAWLVPSFLGLSPVPVLGGGFTHA